MILNNLITRRIARGAATLGIAGCLIAVGGTSATGDAPPPPGPEPEICVVAFPEGGSAEVRIGEWYSFSPTNPKGELNQTADLFTEPSWQGEDLGYGIEGDQVDIFFWAADQDCALWYRLRVVETTGWTPAFNVDFAEVRHR